ERSEPQRSERQGDARGFDVRAAATASTNSEDLKTVARTWPGAFRLDRIPTALRSAHRKNKLSTCVDPIPSTLPDIPRMLRPRIVSARAILSAYCSSPGATPTPSGISPAPLVGTARVLCSKLPW